MPNHVVNVITPLNTTTVQELREAICDGDEVSFDRLVPMPVWLPGFVTDNLSMEDQKGSRGRNWYDWSVTNWGTKWGAYKSVISDSEIRFQTAWSFPDGIVYALARLGLDFEWRYADEDIGANCGILRAEGGDVTEREITRMEEWAQRLWDSRP